MSITDDEARYRARIGKGVRVERILLDLSQQQLADAAGVTRNFVSAVERSRVTLDAYRLAKLAAALGMPLHQLLADPGQQTLHAATGRHP